MDAELTKIIFNFKKDNILPLFLVKRTLGLAIGKENLKYFEK